MVNYWLLNIIYIQSKVLSHPGDIFYYHAAKNDAKRNKIYEVIAQHVLLIIINVGRKDENVFNANDTFYPFW